MAQKRITTAATTEPVGMVADGDVAATIATAPASEWNAGDLVEIVVRDHTPNDIKSQLYYPHLGGLSGRILKIYGEEAGVQIERTTLPDAIRTRHNEMELAMRQKWLDGLSEEARSKLGDKEKEFNLAYTVLVSLKDLLKRAPGDELHTPPPTPEIEGATEREKAAAHEAAAAIDPLTGESDVADAQLLIKAEPMSPSGA